MRPRAKIAISVAGELLEKVERERKKSGETRSAVFERAVIAYFSENQRSESAKRYVDAYRREPEAASEVKAALKTAVTTLSDEPWDAKG